MNRIAYAREQLELSQADLAEKLGVHQTTVSRFEKGRLPLDERTALALDALLLRAGKPVAPALDDAA